MPLPWSMAGMRLMPGVVVTTLRCASRTTAQWLRLYTAALVAAKSNTARISRAAVVVGVVAAVVVVAVVAAAAMAAAAVVGVGVRVPPSDTSNTVSDGMI